MTFSKMGHFDFLYYRLQEDDNDKMRQYTVDLMGKSTSLNRVIDTSLIVVVSCQMVYVYRRILTVNLNEFPTWAKIWC